MDDRQLRLAAAADDPHHPVAGWKRVAPGPAARHLAGQLEARDVLGRPGRRRIAAAALMHVGAVEPGRPDA